MKDKFDLFERYSDDVVGEYICAFVGIDNLQVYNKFNNYLIGDAIIDEVKDKLIELFGMENVYRFSNARFIVMQPITKSRLGDYDYREKQMQKIGDDIIHEIEPFISVNTSQNDKYRIKLRVGIASDDKYQQVQNLFLLVKLADTCHEMARVGKKSYVYTDHLFIKEEVEKEEIRAIIKPAVDNNEFVPYYQPIISVLERKVVGMEAFVRWQRDIQSVLTPDLFLDIAEEKEIIHDIDLNIIEQVFQTVHIWHEDEIIEEDFKVNINLANNSVERLNFKFIADLAKKYNIDTRYVSFELRPSIFNIADFNELISNIRRNGFKVVIDHFGTKDISLKIITPNSIVDAIKVDKSLLPTSTVNSTHEKLYSAIVNFANVINADIIAIGVETLKHVDFCNFCGIDKVQGHYFTKVINESEFRYYLEKYKDSQS